MLPLPFIVSVCYALFLLLLWLPKAPKKLVLSAAGLSITLHLILAAITLFQGNQLHLDFLTSISAISALTLTGRFVFLRGSVPRFIDSSLIIMALVLTALQSQAHITSPFTHTEGLAFSLHLIIAISAYVLLTLAAILAATLWVADKRLHQKPSSRIAQSLPPLLSLEKKLFYLLWIGFVLLSITLLTGFAFSEQLFGKAFVFSHKILFSSLAWIVFATLLTGRVRHGWRGRIAITWTLTGFGFLVLAYAGSKFVLEILLHRPMP